MIRINKWLSEMGVCSRKQADNLIQQDKVLVNGQIAKLGMLIASEDKVTVDGVIIENRPKPVFLLYHKPVGVVCSYHPDVKNNIGDAVNYPQRVFAVGRLDKESEGLILLTNQGDVVNKIMRAENKHDKVYKVWVDKALDDDFIQQMASGVEILDTVTLPCQVTKLASQCFEITLNQGLNRQIRRMCKALGYRVERLQRVSIMQFALDDLTVGATRLLSENEAADLLKTIEHSSNII